MFKKLLLLGFLSFPICVQAQNIGIINPQTNASALSTGTLPGARLNGNYFDWALQNCTLAASVATNILTVALKDNAGNDPSATSPCNINYRNSTAATGSTTLVAQTAALSITTNATGATLGTVNNTAFRFWVVSFNNSGTNVLALFNASTSTAGSLGQCRAIDETQVQTSVAISGSATSAGVYYTPNGTTITSQAIRILGYIEYNSTGLATAGTYASGPNFIQVFGAGIHKPCDIVQSVYNGVGTLQTSSGATYPTIASPGNTISLSMTSAANLVRVNATANPQSASTATVELGIFRANTTFACTTAVGIPKIIGAGVTGTSDQGVLSFSSIDKPNIAASSSVVVYGYCFGVTTAASQASGADLMLDEIMG